MIDTEACDSFDTVIRDLHHMHEMVVKLIASAHIFYKILLFCLQNYGISFQTMIIKT
jgi:hypothetical protein